MRKSKLAFLALFIILLASFLSGCGPTNQEPTASFSANPTSGEVPLEVTFDASNSSDSDGSIISYNWDFDDGSTGSGQTTNHTFSSEGSYTVELIVTDNVGATDSTTATISVSAKPNEFPNASLSASPTSGEAPLDVAFDASDSNDTDGSVESYSWDFDDGSTGSGKVVDHTYNNSGTYNVEITVTDDDGATDSASETISVSQSNQAPTARFSADPSSGESPLEVTFDASDSSDPDGSIESFSWDFDDSSTGSGETISHTFELQGKYTVELTVTDNDGATDIENKIISVSGEQLEILDWELIEGTVQNAVIEGTVKNHTRQKVETGTVSADFYCPRGVKLGTYSSFVYDIEPGDTKSFKLTTGLDYNEVDRVENLEAEAHF